LVLPVHDNAGKLIAVFDIDSNQPDAFTAQDAAELERLLRDVFTRL
jgi:GAF domain-containing protein